MIPDTIEREVLIDAPTDVVWSMVTEADQIARWFSTTAELDLRPGGAGELFFEGPNKREKLHVVTVEPPRLFSFRWIYPDGAVPAPGNSTLVEFTLEPMGASTLLRVVESGFAGLDRPSAQDEFDDHTTGWAAVVASFASYAAGRVSA
jgi:uncharacterized protein YndB with AHSA1/START domain